MLIVVDLETTGLVPGQAGIWDVAAVAIEGGEVRSEFESLVCPGAQYLKPEHLVVIEKVSAIAASEALPMLERAPRTAEVRAQLIDWLIEITSAPLKEVGVPQVPVRARLTSFNRAFDWPFLLYLDWELPFFTTVKAWLEFPETPCIMQIAEKKMRAAGWDKRRANGDPAWPSLREACTYFGVEFVETHRALADARAAAALAIKLGARG